MLQSGSIHPTLLSLLAPLPMTKATSGLSTHHLFSQPLSVYFLENSPILSGYQDPLLCPIPPCQALLSQDRKDVVGS